MNILQKLTRIKKSEFAAQPEKRKVGYYIETTHGLYEHISTATGLEIEEARVAATEDVEDFHSILNKATANNEEFVKLDGYVCRLSDLKRIYVVNYPA